MRMWLSTVKTWIYTRKRDNGNVSKVNKNVYNEFMLIFFKGPRKIIFINYEYLLTNSLEA